MVNKKKRLFKLLFFPISLLICLSIFMISSFAQSGFTVDNNGNIESLNLLPNSSNITASNSNVFFDVNIEQGQTYTFSVQNGSNSGAYALWLDLNGSLVQSITDSTGINSSITFVASSNANRLGLYPNNINNANIMLNKGSTRLDYFPYGYYIDNNTINKMSLYNLFNGSTVVLNGYYENLNNSYTMAIDILNLSVDQKFITLDDMPNIQGLINSGRNDDDWIVNADTYFISFYLNKQQANFSVLFADFVSSRQFIRLSGSPSGLYDKFIYNTNVDSQSFIFSTSGVEYNFMYLFNELGYNQNFKIGLSYSSSAYNDGYNDGYTSAINSSDAFNSGFNSGYQNGYNDGINTDLQTNGLRTLFNSILSFPVDMIKSVFNFEFMGVNIASVIMFIVSIGIVAFVLKKFL